MSNTTDTLKKVLYGAGPCIAAAAVGEVLVNDPLTPLGVLAGYKATGGTITGAIAGGVLGGAAQVLIRKAPVIGQWDLTAAPAPVRGVGEIEAAADEVKVADAPLQLNDAYTRKDVYQARRKADLYRAEAAAARAQARAAAGEAARARIVIRQPIEAARAQADTLVQHARSAEAEARIARRRLRQARAEGRS